MKQFLVAVTASLLSTSAALGNDGMTTFSVGATITDACSVAASDLAFGKIDPLHNAGNASDASTTINVTCANGTEYHIALDAGTSAADTNKRVMSGDSDTLEYALYSDAARSQHWGDTLGSDTVADIGTGSTQAMTVYARVPAGQETAATGHYSDIVTVTITY